ncbi:hypothetical protein N2601_29795 (plasmid) [Rhizobium sp. CB3060]|uniref:AMP-binding enzyme n=1 Tax=Rhizobium sp. CB3060 TaxID=3138255 RepID=UPI0021A29B50|nr:hypothetical protein [Rhizobium tropici]UWU25645.1 hypothetical protein N2601_29795 [Rhizobium tropici]
MTEGAITDVPGPERTEIVNACVVLGVFSVTCSAEELSMFVKAGLSAHAFRRAIEFMTELPKTQSGKITAFHTLQIRNRKT